MELLYRPFHSVFPYVEKGCFWEAMSRCFLIVISNCSWQGSLIGLRNFHLPKTFFSFQVLSLVFQEKFFAKELLEENFFKKHFTQNMLSYYQLVSLHFCLWYCRKFFLIPQAYPKVLNATNLRDVSRTKPNIYDGTFSQK